MMIIQSNIPLALGDLINLKAYFDDVKNQYEIISLTFHKELYVSGVNSGKPDWPQKKLLWDKYLFDIGNLFFSEHPYRLNQGDYGFRDTMSLIRDFRLRPRKPELGHLLCKGQSLNLGEEYIVITTKIRELSKGIFFPLSIQLWTILRQLSKRYKIVVLGERVVEMRREYGVYPNAVFGIYEQVISNLPSDRIVDLTVPALGETVTDLTKIQQDCLIMKEAKFVITLGIGGNFVMATAVSNMVVGFRGDNHSLADQVFTQEYPNAIITKDWNHFINVLKRYL